MTGLIERFGVLGVFLLMVPESACIPVPSELTLLFSGFAVHQGWMGFAPAVLAATAGNLVGSLLAYGVGASGLADRVPVLRTALARWEAMLEHHGLRAVFIARLLPLARTFVSLPAGARRVNLSGFIVLTTLGCAVWAAGLMTVGVLAGGAWSTADSVLGRVFLAAAALMIALPAIGRALARHRHAERSVSVGARSPVSGPPAE